MRLIVVKAHTREVENPITLTVGEKVQVRYAKNEPWNWLGDVFCTLQDGRSGWTMHSTFEEGGSFPEIEPSEATVAQEYSAIELNVEVGEILAGFATTNQGQWCRNARGESGWVPFECFVIDEVDLERCQKELVTEIESAFANIEKGKGMGLREAAWYDAFPTPEQLREARELDIERWQDLSSGLVRSHSQALFYTDLVSFRYLLPAFMRASLGEYSSDSRDFAKETVTRILSGFPVKTSDANLIFEQTRAIAHFCELMLDIGVNSDVIDERSQRDLTQEWMNQINENLSSEWFKAPLQF